ncbi:hypothetical protein HN371_19950 [Candidatus Poribacteria bacterium]|jgi:hypothetical protein|nr:hypothetical protein [Candidatus Poribacteria bacterium]MBT5709736.1 hypothetical protein [Candidatus Poribacteria bacterium]MBT7101366.1 hypothetical protein [Candidatus Poribacteria bacterium]MBT7806617.1 hypothetical protein [Candidatus Poribacteria bacterium]
MTRYTALVAGLGLAVGVSALARDAHAGDVDVALDFTYASAHYWRGGQAPAGTNGFVQPTLDVSHPVGDGSLGLNVWYMAGPKDEAKDNSEIDYTVSGSYPLGDVAVSAGVIDYVFPVGPAFRAPNDQDEQGHILEAYAGADVGALIDPDLGLAVNAYMNLDGDEDDSLYIQTAVSYPLGHLTLGLTLGVAGESPSYYGVDSTALVDVSPNVAFDIPLGDEASAAAAFTIAINPETDAILPFFTIGTTYNWNP